MYLVNETDDVRISLQFLDKVLQALLELSAILRSCHHRCHIKRYQAAVVKNWRHLVVSYQLCQALYDGTLAHSRLTNEYGVILLTAQQNLLQTLYLLFTSHHRVHLAFAGKLRQVCGESVYHRRLRRRIVIAVIRRLCFRNCTRAFRLLSCLSILRVEGVVVFVFVF